MTVKDSSLYPRITEIENGAQLDDGTLLKDDKKDSKVMITPMKSCDVNLPPDGGVRAWSIMVASYLINGVVFSIINSFSAIFDQLEKRLKEGGHTQNISDRVSLVGSLAIGTTFLLSMLSGILTDKFGIQMTTFIGGAIAAAGLFLSSFLTNQLYYLYLTYGLMFGLGASLAYTPSLVILGHYFSRRLGFVNGVVTCGSSSFTMVMPYIMDFFLNKFGLEGTLRYLSVLTAMIMACAVLFKPIPPDHSVEKKVDVAKKNIINFSIFKKKKYVIWAIAIPIALFGYFVPYVYLRGFMEQNFADQDHNLPLTCIAVTSGVGRLVFGYIADRPKVDRIMLQQISFFCIGLLTMALAATEHFYQVICIALGIGLVDGCFISLLGPIAFDICKQEGATQAIGFLLGMCSIPLTIGPPIAGKIRDMTGSYSLPFLLAGISPIVGATAMFMIRFVKDDEENCVKVIGELPQVQESLTDSKWQNGVPILEFKNETNQARNAIAEEEKTNRKADGQKT